MTLSELRASVSLSQADVAEKLGTTQSLVSQHELGQTTPRLDRIGDYARVYGVSVGVVCAALTERKRGDR